MEKDIDRQRDILESIMKPIRDALGRAFPIHYLDNITRGNRFVIFLSDVYSEKEILLLKPLRYNSNDIIFNFYDDNDITNQISFNMLNTSNVDRIRWQMNTHDFAFTSYEYWNEQKNCKDWKKLDKSVYPLLLTSDMPFPGFATCKNKYGVEANFEQKTISNFQKKYITGFKNTQHLIKCFGDLVYDANLQFQANNKLLLNAKKKYNILKE